MYISSSPMKATRPLTACSSSSAPPRRASRGARKTVEPLRPLPRCSPRAPGLAGCWRPVEARSTLDPPNAPIGPPTSSRPSTMTAHFAVFERGLGCGDVIEHLDLVAVGFVRILRLLERHGVGGLTISAPLPDHTDGVGGRPPPIMRGTTIAPARRSQGEDRREDVGTGPSPLSDRERRGPRRNPFMPLPPGTNR